MKKILTILLSALLYYEYGKIILGEFILFSFPQELFKSLCEIKRRYHVKRVLLWSLVLMVAFSFGCTKASDMLNSESVSVGSLSAPMNAVPGQSVPGEYIVVLKSHASSRGIEAVTRVAEKLAARHGVDFPAVKKHVFGTAIKGFSARLNENQLQKLAEDIDVAYIEPVQVVGIVKKPVVPPDDDPAGQAVPWGITRVGGGVDATGAVAWVIDTGIDLDHPDLNVDTNRSRTFVVRTKDANDENGHGTHVAGTIAAKDNSIGVIGVAANATVVSVRVLDRRGSGTTDGVIAGVDYVAANGAPGDVANMSLGGGISTALDEAVLNAAANGIKFAIAAGNEAQNANNCSPARVNHTNVYTISAIDSSDRFAYFSNYANPPVDYAAPGVGILSLYKNSGTATLDGTSMASPHVAGLLLLGSVHADGYAVNDPDGNPDPIAHH